MVVWLLIGCSFMFLLLRIGLPYGVRTEGVAVTSVQLSFGEKLLLQRKNMYAVGAILILSAIGQWFPTTIISPARALPATMSSSAPGKNLGMPVCGEQN